MRMTYSPQVDAFYIRLSQVGGHIRTMEVRPGVHLVDPEDRCVGLELQLERLDRPNRRALTPTSELHPQGGALPLAAYLAPREELRMRSSNTSSVFS